MPDLLTAAPSAFAHKFPAAAGVQIEERAPGLATVQIGNRPHAAFAEGARTSFGLVPPLGPHRVEKDGLSLIGIGPGSWLAVRDPDPLRLAPDLARAFAGLASVSDQSSGYTVLRLSGPRARAILQAGLPVDLDPAAFSTDSAAVSLISHIGVILWQAGPELFEIAFFRSMSDSFAHWLKTQITQPSEKL
jgi:sarcosine oxidase subunit gamma